METSFWHEKWEKNEIAFHSDDVNRMLAAHFQSFGLADGARIFLPLCGKTLDIQWLLSKGHKVVGAELSEIAIKQLFEDLGVEPAVTPVGELLHYHAPNIDMFVGDIFDLTRARLGPVDAVYDRAALVALPEDLRARYAEHMVALTEGAPQFLISFDYDQSEMNGPPFSVVESEVRALYSAHYDISLTASEEVPGRLKGVAEAQEMVWFLR